MKIVIYTVIIFFILLIILIINRTNKNKTKITINTSELQYKHKPLVSAICVTKNRVPFLKRAIRDFMSQTYDNKELVIVCDSNDYDTNQYLDSIRLGLPLVVVRNNNKVKLGALRNMGIKAANGTYIIQWDDDDEYHPKRIEIQLKVVQNYNKKACCLSRWVIYDNHSNNTYISPYYTWEGSILSEKRLLIENPYPNIARGEDTVVITKLQKNNDLFLLDMPELYIYHLHWNNTWDRNHGIKMINNSIKTDYEIPCSKKDIDFFNTAFKVVYINLERSPKMKESIEKSAHQAKIKIERFEAIDGSKIKLKKNKLSAGEQGCLASHKSLWKRFSNSDKPVIICEDDIVFNKNISRNILRKIQYMSDMNLTWNIILLYAGIAKDHSNISWSDCYYNESHLHGYGIVEMGEQKTQIPHIPQGITSCIPTNSCYLVTPQACKELLRVTEYYDDSIPADVVLSIVMKHYRQCYYIQGQINILRGPGDTTSDIKKIGGYKWKGEGLKKL